MNYYQYWVVNALWKIGCIVIAASSTVVLPLHYHKPILYFGILMGTLINPAKRISRMLEED